MVGTALQFNRQFLHGRPVAIAAHRVAVEEDLVFIDRGQPQRGLCGFSRIEGKPVIDDLVPLRYLPLGRSRGREHR